MLLCIYIESCRAYHFFVKNPLPNPLPLPFTPWNESFSMTGFIEAYAGVNESGRRRRLLRAYFIQANRGALNPPIKGTAEPNER